jgi:hypothetical protein
LLPKFTRQTPIERQRWEQLSSLAEAWNPTAVWRPRPRKNQVLAGLIDDGLVEVLQPGNTVPADTYVRLTETGWSAYRAGRLPTADRRPARRTFAVARGK